MSRIEVRKSLASEADAVVVGAGAAGLAAAIFTARAGPGLRVVCLDGARTVGAKILISGGTRCNVTNRVVTERDFWGGRSRAVKAVLRAFPAERAADFFAEIGVDLHEEDGGKLFPDSNRARTVLDALLAECGRLGVAIVTSQRVEDIRPVDGVLHVDTQDQVVAAPVVVLATGGCSVPKSGSDGFGYELARRLGHGHVPVTPALVPLVLSDSVHARLSGVSHTADISLIGGAQPGRWRGQLLWTHFGASGPVVLDASRHWLRAVQDGRTAELVLNLLPGETVESLERLLVDATERHPRRALGSFFRSRLPAAVAAAWVEQAGLAPALPIGQLSRVARRKLAESLIGARLDVRGSRGFNYAEVTAGGVPLDEIDPATMASRVHEGLYLVGEVLDVDGRLGGVNFQWAWASGFVAGQAIARRAAQL